MAEDPALDRFQDYHTTRRSGLTEADLARADPHLREALNTNKREGLLLAVRARWIALAIVAALALLQNPVREALYYVAAAGGFALIGWAQLRAGRVAQSRAELLLIFCDLALLTFVLVVPNPLRSDTWPTAFQYSITEFGYFYVLLAIAALGYSWRTLLPFGLWTAVLWLGALALVATFGREIPELSDKAKEAFAGYPAIMDENDPNNPKIAAQVREVVIFLIVAGILGLNGRRTTRLMFQQANATRERANLARHFPPGIVDEMAGRDQPLGAVRSQEVAVMFVDIVGFTRMAEQQTAGQTVDLLRQFHARMESAVFEHHGTLDKFIGDGLMATFGTPEPGPGDAANALRCAKAMRADMDSWNAARGDAGRAPVRIAIGLHFGPVVLGDIGSERRLEYAVLGDTVNVASRLEALTRSLGVAVAVSDDLVAAVRRDAAAPAPEALSGLDNAGPQRLRGRDEPISLWTC